MMNTFDTLSGSSRLDSPSQPPDWKYIGRLASGLLPRKLLNRPRLRVDKACRRHFRAKGLWIDSHSVNTTRTKVTCVANNVQEESCARGLKAMTSLRSGVADINGA